MDDLDVAAQNFGAVRDPYPRYAEARGAHPVTREAHMGVESYRLYRFAECDQMLRDGETFSSAINGRWMEPFLGRTIIEMDGHEHQRTRGLVGHAFRRQVVQQWEDSLIGPTAHEIIDGFAARGRAELVREFNWQFPVRVFAKILGVPKPDYARWGRWAFDLERITLDWDRGVGAADEVREYFTPIIEERRRAPTGDLISDLVTAEIDGHSLPDDIIHGFIRLLVPAGAGTTYRLTGILLFALLTDAEQMEAVRADRSLVPAAVDEALRWEAPVQYTAREATRDTELGGMPIPKGMAVAAVLGSANRDETRWPDPDRFDVHREQLPSLPFGNGPHFCLGAHLARLEATVATNAILDRLADLRLDPGDGDPHIVGWAFRSPNVLPVTFRAR